ncbi:MAG: hypothetical protein ABSF52_07400 [Syntrophobacteraceae bacterium]|jgi:hypothetical protein
MPPEKPALHEHDVVLLGDFNPKIFQPAWFGSEGLIRKLEVDGAEIAVVHQEVVSFTLEWLKIEVTRERFLATTLQEAYDEPVRDLVLSTFRILRHTPLRKVGINLDEHFQIESEERWHLIGHVLAPKELWEEVLQNPGMKSLIIQGTRPDNLKGYVQVAVAPSGRVHPGVRFNVNDHFEVEKPDSVIGSDEIMNILENNWVESRKRAVTIMRTLMERLNG